MDIVPEALRQKALDVLVDDVQKAGNFTGACQGGDNMGAAGSCSAAKGGPGPHMTAGLFGIKWFLMALADRNQNDLAYDALTNPSYPGFKWMMNNQFDNATTIWESWFFSDNTFSHNHPVSGTRVSTYTLRFNVLSIFRVHGLKSAMTILFATKSSRSCE